MTDKVRLEKIAGIIGDLDHQINDNWDPDGKPALSVFESLALDPPVTRAELDEIDPTYRRTVKFVEPIKEIDETSIATAPPAVVIPVIDVEATKAALKVLDGKVAEKTKVMDAARDDLAKAHALRDKIVGTLAKVRSDDLATLTRKMFATNDATAAARVELLNKFKEATGGAVPQQFASKLDERNANRRTIKRAAQRMVDAAS